MMGLATHNCADNFGGRLPPARGSFFPGGNAGNPFLPVANAGYGPLLFHLLPFIEQDVLYKSTFGNVGGVQIYASWNAAGNTIKAYIAPGDPTANPPPGQTNYLANGLAFPPQGARFPGSFPDGTSNTIFYAEAYSRAVGTLAQGGKTDTWTVERRWWDDPTWVPTLSAIAFQPAPTKEAASARLPQGFSRSGIVVGLGDAGTRFVSAGCSAQTFFHACTPAGGETLGSDW
jgi:hypothetical protein